MENRSRFRTGYKFKEHLEKIMEWNLFINGISEKKIISWVASVFFVFVQFYF